MPTFVLRAAALAAALLPALAPAAPLTLDHAIELALARSQALHSAAAATSAAREMARASGELPDPMLQVGVDNLPVTGPDRFSTTRESMTMKRIGVAQEWLGADKRAARRAVAEAGVERELAAARSAAAQTRLQTALAWLDAWFAARALELATLTEHHAHEQFEAARARLATAGAGSPEVLAASAALGQAEDEAAGARQQQSAAQVALERWIGPSDEPLVAPPALAAAPAAAWVAAHPAVVAGQRQVEVARREAALAATARHPNWTWALSYAQRTGYSDMVSLGVSIPLPVAPAERQDRETAARLAAADQAEADLTEATRAAGAEHDALASDAARLQERIERWRDAVLRPAAQRTAAALAAYRASQLALAALFESRHAEVEAQQKLLALERDLARTRARLAYTPITEGAQR